MKQGSSYSMIGFALLFLLFKAWRSESVHNWMNDRIGDFLLWGDELINQNANDVLVDSGETEAVFNPEKRLWRYGVKIIDADPRDFSWESVSKIDSLCPEYNIKKEEYYEGLLSDYLRPLMSNFSTVIFPVFTDFQCNKDTQGTIKKLNDFIESTPNISCFFECNAYHQFKEEIDQEKRDNQSGGANILVIHQSVNQHIAIHLRFVEMEIKKSFLKYKSTQDPKEKERITEWFFDPWLDSISVLRDEVDDLPLYKEPSQSESLFAFRYNLLLEKPLLNFNENQLKRSIRNINTLLDQIEEWDGYGEQRAQLHHKLERADFLLDFSQGDFEKKDALISKAPDELMSNILLLKYIEDRLSLSGIEDSLIFKLTQELSSISVNLTSDNITLKEDFQRVLDEKTHLEKRSILVSKIYKGVFIFMFLLLIAIPLYLIWRKNRELDTKNQELWKTNSSLTNKTEELSDLKRELSHRVKNSLLDIGSQIQIQIRKIKQGQALDPMILLTETNSRILAIQLIHSQLQEVGANNKISFGAYLVDLCNNLRKVTQYEDANFEADIDLDDLFPVSVGLASRIGLVITELILNASKHTMSDSKKLEVNAKTEKEQLILSFKDNGPGIPEDIKFNAGLRMVKNVIENQLKGRITLLPTSLGTHWELLIPLENLAYE